MTYENHNPASSQLLDNSLENNVSELNCTGGGGEGETETEKEDPEWEPRIRSQSS